MFVVMVTFLAVNVAMGSDSGKIKVEMKPDVTDFATVEVADMKISDKHVMVTNEFGDLVYDRKIKTPAEKFRTRYDFSGLEDGRYQFIVKLDDEKTVNTFEVERGEIQVLETRKSADPYFNKEGDFLQLSFLNFQEEDVKMYVYDRSNNKLLYKKELGSQFAIHHAVDISSLRYGDYEVVISNDKDNYEHWISFR